MSFFMARLRGRRIPEGSANAGPGKEGSGDTPVGLGRESSARGARGRGRLRGVYRGGRPGSGAGGSGGGVGGGPGGLAPSGQRSGSGGRASPNAPSESLSSQVSIRVPSGRKSRKRIQASVSPTAPNA